ncbi:MAG: hypothetical protein M3Y54_10075 [Bacteroidota bacterium]|nr:hypothetical protein [Bacteroidota bacterium]
MPPQTGELLKEQQLVELLLKTKAPTSTQVAKALYGEATAASQVALRRLKGRVQAKLLNHLYFLDHRDPRSLISRRYQLECLDLLHKGTALFAEGEYVLSQRLLRRCLSEARAGEFTTYAVQSARQLALIYAQLRKPAEYAKVDRVLEKTLRVQQLEDEAERLYTSTFLGILATVKSRRTMLPELPERLQRLEALHRRANTFNTYLWLYQLRMAHEELQGDFAGIIRLTSAAARQLGQGKLNARRFDVRYNTFMSVFAYLRSRQPAKGLRLAQEGIRHFSPTSSNWFTFQENHLLLALHSKKYDYARQLLQTVLANPSFAKLRPLALEQWELYQGYLDLAAGPNSAGAPISSTPKWALRLPEFSRDKQGPNVAILVLQLLYCLRRQQIDEALVRLERLRKYQQRHLNAAETQRSRLFLRLLRTLADTGFDPAKASHRGRATLDTLAQTPPPGEAFAEIEIIPYEQLWELVLQQLRPAKG